MHPPPPKLPTPPPRQAQYLKSKPLPPFGVRCSVSYDRCTCNTYPLPVCLLRLPFTRDGRCINKITPRTHRINCSAISGEAPKRNSKKFQNRRRKGTKFEFEPSNDDKYGTIDYILLDNPMHASRSTGAARSHRGEPSRASAGSRVEARWGEVEKIENTKEEKKLIRKIYLYRR